MVAIAGGAFAVALAAVALLRDAVPVLLVLLPAGVAWVVVLSTLNASLQLFLPAWVRGRSLAIYTIVLFGGQALGAIVFGALADTLGLVRSTSDRRGTGGPRGRDDPNLAVLRHARHGPQHGCLLA
jgi:hypothetical protein